MNYYLCFAFACVCGLLILILSICFFILKKYNWVKKNLLLLLVLLLSIISIILSVINICNAGIRLDFEATFYSTMAAIMALPIAILIGWNIYSALNIERKVLKIEDRLNNLEKFVNKLDIIVENSLKVIKERTEKGNLITIAQNKEDVFMTSILLIEANFAPNMILGKLIDNCLNSIIAWQETKKEVYRAEYVAKCFLRLKDFIETSTLTKREKERYRIKVEKILKGQEFDNMFDLIDFFNNKIFINDLICGTTKN